MSRSGYSAAASEWFFVMETTVPPLGQFFVCYATRALLPSATVVAGPFPTEEIAKVEAGRRTAEDAGEPDHDFEPIPCPTCKGSGTVNPLTAPNWYFCIGTTTCPACEGTGEME